MFCSAAVAATQSVVRAYVHRRWFLAGRRGTVKAQARLRGRNQRRKFVFMRCSAMMLQCRVRQIVAKARVTILRRHKRSTTIQAWWRGIRVRVLAFKDQRAAMVIQSMVRVGVSKIETLDLNFVIDDAHVSAMI